MRDIIKLFFALFLTSFSILLIHKYAFPILPQDTGVPAIDNIPPAEKPTMPTTQDIQNTATQANKVIWSVLAIATSAITSSIWSKFTGFFGGFGDFFGGMGSSLLNNFKNTDPSQALNDISGIEPDIIQAVEQHGGNNLIPSLINTAISTYNNIDLSRFNQSIRNTKSLLQAVNDTPTDIVEAVDSTKGGLFGSAIMSLSSSFIHRLKELFGDKTVEKALPTKTDVVPVNTPNTIATNTPTKQADMPYLGNLDEKSIATLTGIGLFVGSVLVCKFVLPPLMAYLCLVPSTERIFEKAAEKVAELAK